MLSISITASSTIVALILTFVSGNTYFLDPVDSGFITYKIGADKKS